MTEERAKEMIEDGAFVSVPPGAVSSGGAVRLEQPVRGGAWT